MKRRLFGLVAALSSVLLTVGVTALSGAGDAAAAAGGRARADSSAATCPWLNRSLPVQRRVSLLLSRMTLADKIGMVHGVSGPYVGNVAANPALCIPALGLEDGPAGVADGMTGVTQLPAPVAGAASWDPSLMRQYGAVIGAEERGKGAAVNLGPTINIVRDPRWGRAFETLGEDPYLAGQLGSAEIDGVQAQGVLSQVKHFDAYNQETYRNTPADDVIVSDRALHEIYMPAFWTALTKGKAASVMCAYSTVNGQYSCQNPHLLQTLERRWAWPGFVTSDWGATHSTVPSADAGLDMQMPDSSYYGAPLQQAVQDGQVPMATLNEMVRRILTEMFRFDLFNNPPSGSPSAVVTSRAHAAVARTVAEQGMVLLKNTGGLLPLGPRVKSIAVIGPDGTTNPESAGGGSASVRAPYVVSPLQGIQARAGSGTTVTSYPGTDPTQAAAAAKAAQVAIVFANNFESEGSDLSSITLQNDQDAYIEAVAQANPNTIVVLNTGSAVTMPWVNQVRGVLEAWYPGQEDGNAVAAVLFGDVNPSGKLPVTFPQSLSQVPASTPAQWPGVNGQVQYSEGVDVGYRWYDAKNLTPLFPFGYGLSYTTFKFSHLRITPKAVRNRSSGPGATDCGCNGQNTKLVTVTATVTNTGDRAGADVAQLYLGDPTGAGEPPRQLKGFSKVYLQPGQSTTVRFTLDGHDLSYFDSAADGWVVADGDYRVYVGDSSALANLPLHGAFTVTRTVGARFATVTAPGTVAPLATVTVTAHFVNDGDYALHHTQASLETPQGWRVRLTSPIPATILAHQSVTARFTVTVPESAQGSTATLAARLSYQPGPAGRQTGLIEADTTVTVEPAVTATATPVTIHPGASATSTLTLTSHLPHPVTASFTVSPPSSSGLTVTPTTGSITVPPQGATTTLTVTAGANAPGGATQVPVTVSFTDHGQTYSVPPTQIQVTVVFANFAAAYDNVGITSNSDVAPGNFDGVGDSYSEQALTAAGLAPGASVQQDGATLTWPNVPAGQPDNVIAEGQTVDLSGSGANLVLLGAADYGTATGTVTVTYTDGTTQQQTINVADWYANAPAQGEQLVATTSSWNTQPGSGQSPHAVSVYSNDIPLQSGKSVQSVTLPDISSGVGSGVTAMHVFAMAVGG